MELVTGITVASKLARGALSEEEVLQFGQQIAQALEHAHGYGVVHRDLKPGNVIIRTDGQLKVVDFGLAKLSDHRCICAYRNNERRARARRHASLHAARATMGQTSRFPK